MRSFGADPELVARHVAAFVTGTQRQGVAACAKHFPGHGDTAADSHRELPMIEGDLDARAAAVPRCDRRRRPGGDGRPSARAGPRRGAGELSEPILSGLLRGELGFDGLIVTDALEMAAVSSTYGVEEAAVRALVAGADALWLGHDLHEEAVEQVHAAIVDAVRTGRLAEERLADAAERVAALCRWASPTSAGAAGREVGAEAARRALRCRGDVTISGPIVVLELVPEANIAAGEAAARARRRPARRCLGAASRSRPTWPRSSREHEDRRLVVVARDAARHAWQEETVAAAAALRPDLVVVETGIPSSRPEAGASIVTLGAGRANLEAMAAATR